MDTNPLAIPAIAAIGAQMTTSQGSPAPAEKPITPAWQPLQAGDLVAFVAPSHAQHRESYKALGETLQQWGLTAVQQDDMVRQPAYFEWPNTPERRADHIIAALQDPNVKAIVALEGGEGASEVVETLKKREAELDALPRRAIPLIGYSDITQLHLFLGQKGLVSPVQGPSVEFLTQQPGMDAAQQATVAANQEALRDFLMGAQDRQPLITLVPLNPAAKETPHIKGTLIGGSDIPIGTTGQSSHRLKADQYGGQILFLEGRSSAALRFALQSLKDRNQLGRADAIVLGRYYDNQQYSGDLSQAYTQEIQKTLNDLGVTKPVYFGVPAGHTGNGFSAPVVPVPLHTQAEISATPNMATLSISRFRDMADCDYHRSLAQEAPTPPPPTINDHSPIILAPIAFNELHLPDIGIAMQKNFKDRKVVLDFGEHATITTMHMAMMELLGSGKLATAKSLVLASSQPVAPEAEAWLKDFQQRHLPQMEMKLMHVPETKMLSAIAAGTPDQQGPPPR